MKKSLTVAAFVLCGAAATWAQGPSSLSVLLGTPAVNCPEGDVSVSFSVSSGAASAATVTATLTDDLDAEITSVSYDVPAGPDGWIIGGSVKTHDGLFQYPNLGAGTYDLEVCVTQNGVLNCSTTAIIVNCSAGDPCASATPFGEVVGNTKIKPTATAQIQFRGPFGPSALVEITDSNNNPIGSALVSRNGGSCNYHANWKFTTGSGSDIYGNTGPGVYTVKVSGNGNALEFPVTLN